jgi:hypothetical protein
VLQSRRRIDARAKTNRSTHPQSAGTPSARRSYRAARTSRPCTPTRSRLWTRVPAQPRRPWNNPSSSCSIFIGTPSNFMLEILDVVRSNGKVAPVVESTRQYRSTPSAVGASYKHPANSCSVTTSDMSAISDLDAQAAKLIFGAVIVQAVSNQGGCPTLQQVRRAFCVSACSVRAGAVYRRNGLPTPNNGNQCGSGRACSRGRPGISSFI